MDDRLYGERARAVFEANRQVIAAWVFGSAQHGTIRPGGDLDVAVLFAAPPDLDTLADLRSALQRALAFDAIDLVPLNGANPYLRFEGVSGRPMYCRDPERRAAFVSLTAREYEDEWAFFQRALGQTKETPSPSGQMPAEPGERS